MKKLLILVMMFFSYCVFADVTNDVYGKYQNKVLDKTIEITQSNLTFGFISKKESFSYKYTIDDESMMVIMFVDKSYIKVMVIIVKDKRYAVYFVNEDRRAHV
jgi:hypothetical protein